MTALPHSHQVRADFLEFLDDLKSAHDDFIRDAAADDNQRNIFKVCTAGHATFQSLSRDYSLLSATAGSIRRCAVLAAVRQLSLVRVELRRIVECVAWHVYFIDHPVEYDEFVSYPSRGFVLKHEAPPIEAVTRSTAGWFLSYARERFSRETSGMATAAVQKLDELYASLSGDIHAAKGALGPSPTLALSHDRYDKSGASLLRRQIHDVVAAGALAVVAIEPASLRHLGAIERAWFDWLVGTETARRVRGAPFGVAREPSPTRYQGSL